MLPDNDVGQEHLLLEGPRRRWRQSPACRAGASCCRSSSMPTPRRTRAGCRSAASPSSTCPTAICNMRSPGTGLPPALAGVLGVWLWRRRAATRASAAALTGQGVPTSFRDCEQHSEHNAQTARQTSADDQALPAARLLRRRRPRHPDRRAGAEEIRRAGLCPPRDRAQPLRRRGAAEASARCSSRNSTRSRPSIAQCPVVFSAHGVPKSVPADAQARNLFYLDATCPLVSKVHKQAMRHQRLGRHVLLIGHAGHPEVIGTMGQLPEGAVTLIETEADVADLRAGRPVSARLRHADDAVGRGHGRHHPRAAGALSRTEGAGRRIDLLCHHQPPGSGQGDRARRRSVPGRRRAEFVEFARAWSKWPSGPARRCRFSCSAPPKSRGMRSARFRRSACRPARRRRKSSSTRSSTPSAQRYDVTRRARGDGDRDGGFPGDARAARCRADARPTWPSSTARA